MTPTLDMHTASKSYGTGHTRVDALVNASVRVAPGELVAIMGPSGSGKSTLLSLAGGLDHPTSGTVRIEGTDLAEVSQAALARLRRHRIGYVFQQFNLIDGLTAVENVSLPLELDGVARRSAREAALQALDSVDMSDLADRFPEDLSGGEQQRAAIARAIVGDRLLLLADEPTGALDSLTGETVLRLLRHHCDLGGAAMLVTHDAGHAAWADRIVFLRDGHVVDEASGDIGPELLLDGSARP
jgi:putative ABC transport system ATP-binding protein